MEMNHKITGRNIAKDISNNLSVDLEFVMFENDLYHFQQTKHKTFKAIDIDGNINESIITDH
jgi:hypothetical protein